MDIFCWKIENLLPNFQRVLTAAATCFIIVKHNNPKETIDEGSIQKKIGVRQSDPQYQGEVRERQALSRAAVRLFHRPVRRVARKRHFRRVSQYVLHQCAFQGRGHPYLRYLAPVALHHSHRGGQPDRGAAHRAPQDESGQGSAVDTAFHRGAVRRVHTDVRHTSRREHDRAYGVVCDIL